MNKKEQKAIEKVLKGKVLKRVVDGKCEQQFTILDIDFFSGGKGAIIWGEVKNKGWGLVLTDTQIQRFIEDSVLNLEKEDKDGKTHRIVIKLLTKEDEQ